MKPKLLPYVLDSFERLKAEADLVLVEGAGSASEVNLRRNDIANMGFARAAERAGRADRRHRPRRRDREPRRHQGGARSRGCGADRGLHRQQVSRRSEPVRRRQGGDRAGDRLAGARARAVFSERGICRPRMRWRSIIARQRRKDAPSSRSPCRSCRTSPISTISIRWRPKPMSIWSACGPARRCRAMPISSSCPARRRRSPISRRLRAGGFDIDIAAHVRRGGNGARPVRRLSDARPDGQPIPTASKGQPARCTGLGLLDVETMLSADKTAANAERHDERRRAVRRLRDAYGRDQGAGLRAAVRAARRRHAGGRDVGGRPRHRHLCPRAVRRRPPARGVACAPRRRPHDDRL